MKIKIKEIFFSANLFIFLAALFLLLMAIQPPGDPDMGWHLKNGEYLLAHNLQFPQTDIFSYSMADFPLIMHEWLTDIAMFFLYSKTGLAGLMLIFAIIASLAFYLVAKSIKADKIHQLIGALLGIIAIYPLVGVRPQMITLLGLSAVIFIIYQYKNKNKYKQLINWLPAMFFFWVNLHGGFAIGLFFLGVFSFIEVIKKLIVENVKFLEKIKNQVFSWPELARLIIISALSFLATLINPYQIRIYYEVVTTIFDDYAKNFIGEWHPVTLGNPLSHRFIIFSVLMVVLIIFNRKKIDFTYLIISIIFFFLSISSWRHMPFFILISIPYWVLLVKSLTRDKLRKIINQKWPIIFLIIIIIILANQKIKLFSKLNSFNLSMGNYFSYPAGAVQYLKDKPQPGRMFNEYNWGGYLIWNYPAKVFIDGRMPSWRLTRPDGKKVQILKDYQAIQTVNDEGKALLKDYQISYALLFRGTALNQYLASQGWKILYEDEYSIVLKNPEN